MSLPTKDPAERKIIAFNFADDVGAGLSIVSATIDVSLALGTDPSPAAIKVGSAAISGAQVLQLVGAGVDGCDYAFRCLATDTGGQIHLAQGVLPVRAL